MGPAEASDDAMAVLRSSSLCEGAGAAERMVYGPNCQVSRHTSVCVSGLCPDQLGLDGEQSDNSTVDCTNQYHHHLMHWV